MEMVDVPIANEAVVGGFGWGETSFKTFENWTFTRKGDRLDGIIP